MTDQKKNKLETLRWTTPKGVAIFPHLQRPSEKFGKYEVTLRLPEDHPEVVSFVEKATAMRDRFLAGVKAELIEKKKPAKVKALRVADVVTQELDDTGEPTGFVLVKAKADANRKDFKTGKVSPRVIPVFDASNKRIKDVPAIYGGSEIKVATVAYGYYVPGSDQVGVTLRIEAVQLLKLVSSGGAGNYGFGSEDGFTAEESEGEAAGFTDSEGEQTAEGDEEF